MAGDIRQQGPAAPTPEQHLGTRARSPPVNRPMSVRVTARFYDSVKIEYSRCYDTSKNFQATGDICAALLRRVEHCTEELMTRKDASALGPNPDRPLRYEITFNFIGAPFPTKERTFRSYQKKPTTMAQATEAILATDRMVGLFLMRHDPEFRWISGPVKEYLSSRSRTAKPSVRGPESLCCVPRSRFIPETQSYEYLSGYEMELSFTSICSTRHRQKIHKKISLSSAQCSPLNLAFGEELLSASSRAIESAIDSRRRCLKTFRWLGAMNDSVTVDLRISNNLGPDHDHLSYQFHSKQGLFNHPTGLDCQEFLEEIERTLGRVRDGVDDLIGATDELEIKVIRLDGPQWEACEPLTISLDHSVSYSRRTIEAILSRVQTGITSVLHGNDLAITLSAHHRGHLVMDKTLIAHEKYDPRRPVVSMTPEQEGNAILSKLCHRIQSDIVMVCKDTCSLVDSGDSLPNLSVTKKGQATLAAHVPESVPLPSESVHEQPHVLTPPPTSHSNHPEERALPVEPASLRDNASVVNEARDLPSTNDDGHAGSEHLEATPPSTPSLIDGGMETPRDRDSLFITPEEVRHGSGTMGLVDFRPRIVSDEINDPVIRDFAHFDRQSESPHNDGYGHAMPEPEPKSRAFSPEVPAMPIPIRAAAILPVREIAPVSQVDLLPAKVDVKEEIEYEGDDTMKEVVSEVGDGPEEAMPPVMEGWLEYCCQPLDPIDEEPDSTEIPEPAGELDSPVVEGWLEYWCEPLDPEDEQWIGIYDKQEPAAQQELQVLEGWLEYCCEPLEPEVQQLVESPEPSGSQPAAVLALATAAFATAGLATAGLTTAVLATAEEVIRDEEDAPLEDHDRPRVNDDDGQGAFAVEGVSTVPSAVSSEGSLSDGSGSMYSASECEYRDAPRGKASTAASLFHDTSELQGHGTSGLQVHDTSELQADIVEEATSDVVPSDEERERCSDSGDSTDTDTDTDVRTDELEEAMQLSRKGSQLSLEPSLADSDETLSVAAVDDECLRAFKIHLDDDSLKTISSEPTTVAVTVSEDEDDGRDDESVVSSESSPIPAFVQDEPLGIKGKGVLPPEDHAQSSITPSPGTTGASVEVTEDLPPLAIERDEKVDHPDPTGTDAEIVQAKDMDKPTVPQHDTMETDAEMVEAKDGDKPAVPQRDPVGTDAETVEAKDRDKPAVPQLAPSKDAVPSASAPEETPADDEDEEDPWLRPRRSNPALGVRPAPALFSFPSPIRALTTSMLDARPHTAVPFSRPGGQHTRTQSMSHVGLGDDYRVPLHDALLGTRAGSGWFGSWTSPRASASGSQSKAVSGLSEVPEADEEGSKAGDKEETDDGERRASGYNAIPGFMMFAAGVSFASSMLGAAAK